MIIRWHKGYETGHPIVDFQHRQLFKAFHAMMELCASGFNDRIEGTLDFLVGFTIKHIHDTEVERLMSKHQYPFQHCENHLHERLMDFVATLEQKLKDYGPSLALSEEIGHYMKEALANLYNHIVREKEDRIISKLTSMRGEIFPAEHVAHPPVVFHTERIETPVPAVISVKKLSGRSLNG
jgi:hemerythrin-like metal-binding protein